MLVYGGLLVLTYWQFNRTPTGFIPQQDKGYLLLNVQLPDSASVERTAEVMAQIESIVRATPGVDHTVGISGQSLILGANAAQPRLDVRPAEGLRRAPRAGAFGRRNRRGDPRPLPAGRAGGRRLGLRRTAHRRPGHHRRLQTHRRGPRQSRPGELQRVSDQIVAQGNGTPGLQGLFNSSRAHTPWLYLDIDRTKCMALGVQVSDVFNTLQVYLGSFYVNNFNEFGRTWQVNVQADQRFRNKVPDIRRLQVRNSQGQMIRLGTLMEVRDMSGPVMVMRYNMYSATAITGNTAAGISSGQAIDHDGRDRRQATAARRWPSTGPN